MATTGLNFSTAVDQWVAQTDERMTAVFRQSTQETVSIAQDQIPVDTGFARASVRASTESMPPITDAKGAPGQSYSYDPGNITLAIAGAELGQTIYVGWTANYVLPLEMGHSKQAPSGFVGLAALQWQSTVSRVTEQLKSQVAAGP